MRRTPQSYLFVPRDGALQDAAVITPRTRWYAPLYLTQGVTHRKFHPKNIGILISDRFTPSRSKGLGNVLMRQARLGIACHNEQSRFAHVAMEYALGPTGERLAMYAGPRQRVQQSVR